MIYFLATKDRVKIGYSNNPKARIAQLRTSCPYPLEILGLRDGSREEEKRLHNKFACYRLNREWFTRCIVIERAAHNGYAPIELNMILNLPVYFQLNGGYL